MFVNTSSSYRWIDLPTGDDYKTRLWSVSSNRSVWKLIKIYFFRLCLNCGVAISVNLSTNIVSFHLWSTKCLTTYRPPILSLTKNRRFVYWAFWRVSGLKAKYRALHVVCINTKCGLALYSMTDYTRMRLTARIITIIIIIMGQIFDGQVTLVLVFETRDSNTRRWKLGLVRVRRAVFNNSICRALVG